MRSPPRQPALILQISGQCDVLKRPGVKRVQPQTRITKDSDESYHFVGLVHAAGGPSDQLLQPGDGAGFRRGGERGVGAEYDPCVGDVRLA